CSQDAVHNYEWGVDDDEAVGVFSESFSEEAFVEYFYHLLFAGGAGDLGGSNADGSVELLQWHGFSIQIAVRQDIGHSGHDSCDRVVSDEIVFSKQCIEDRCGD